MLTLNGLVPPVIPQPTQVEGVGLDWSTALSGSSKLSGAFGAAPHPTLLPGRTLNYGGQPTNKSSATQFVATTGSVPALVAGTNSGKSLPGNAVPIINGQYLLWDTGTNQELVQVTAVSGSAGTQTVTVVCKNAHSAGVAVTGLAPVTDQGIGCFSVPSTAACPAGISQFDITVNHGLMGPESFIRCWPSKVKAGVSTPTALTGIYVMAVYVDPTSLVYATTAVSGSFIATIVVNNLSGGSGTLPQTDVYYDLHN